MLFGGGGLIKRWVKKAVSTRTYDAKLAEMRTGACEPKMYAYMPDNWDVLQVEKRKDNGKGLPDADLADKTKRIKCHGGQET